MKKSIIQAPQSFLKGQLVRTLLTSLLLVLFALPHLCEAQDRARRREFVESLLKSLIESQLEPNQQPPQQQIPPNFPTNPNPGRPRVPGQTVLPAQPTKQVIQVRQQLLELSNDAENLIYDLRQEEVRNKAIRPLLGDALQIKANIDLLYRQAMQSVRVAPLLDGLRVVDRDWRILMYRLSQVNGLGNKCRKVIDQFRQHEETLCGTLGIDPQVNRNELLRLTSLFANEFQHLLQDVYYDCKNDPGYRDILKSGQDLRAELNQAVSVIRRGTYEQMVSAFKSCNKDWRRFSRKLRRFESDRLSRDAQQIENIGHQIAELLWLPQEMDRDYICHVIASIQKDSERLFQQVSLDELLKCSQPGLVVAKARDFQRLCGEFSNSVSAGEPIESLLWDFRVFDIQWDEFRSQINELNTSRTTRRMEEIENSLGVLRETFGGGPAINRFTLTQIASSLDQLSNQLSRDIRGRINRNNYSPEFHKRICTTADQLCDHVGAFHRQCVGRNPTLRLKSDLGVVFNDWNRLKTLMNQCSEVDRRQFAKYRSQIEPQMVKLQVVYVD